MTLIILIIIFLVVSGILEKRRHLDRIDHIPIRIHINGTRGKSLLTRMIVDLFRHAGWQVAGKVTGEHPQIFILQSGWQPWKRLAPARIKEQMRFIRKMAPFRPAALVVENMALAPENQRAAESLMIRSTLSVITNFRPDHQEVMGIAASDATSAIAHSVPIQGTVFIPQSEATLAVEKACAHFKANLKTIAGCHRNFLPALPAFQTHFELLEAVRDLYHLPQDAFDQTINNWQNQLKPETFLIPISNFQTKKYLVNLFTCNDVISTELLIESLEQSGVIYPPYEIVLACREDRPLRTMAFLRWLIRSTEWKKIIIAGGTPRIPVRRLLNECRNRNRSAISFKKIAPEKIIAGLDPSIPFTFGLGNYVKTGEKILSYLQGSAHDH